MIALDVDGWTVRDPSPTSIATTTVTRRMHSHVTVAVLASLGRGPSSARAVEGFEEILQTSEANDPVLIVAEADRALRLTSGAHGLVLSIHLPSGFVRGVLVGDVGFECTAGGVTPVRTVGTVGRRLRGISPFDGLVAPGELLALFVGSEKPSLMLADFAEHTARSLVSEHFAPRTSASCLMVGVRAVSTRGVFSVESRAS